MSKKIILIDTSHLMFRAFYAFPKSLLDPTSSPINAVFGVAQMMMSIIEQQKPTHVFAAQDLPTKTKRSVLFEGYKAQRSELDPDMRIQIPRVYDMLRSMNIAIYSEAGYEADDVIATIAEYFRTKEDTQVGILTGDQDAFQLIGENVEVFRPIKNDIRVYTDAFLMAEKSLLPCQIPDFKALSGDPSDNLKGVEGIGEKTAIKLLEEYSHLEGIYTALGNNTIQGALAKKLSAGKEIAFFTRTLATLHRDVPLQDFGEEKGLLSNICIEGACDFFQSIGSNSLQKRMRSIFGAVAPNPVHTDPLSLF